MTYLERREIIEAIDKAGLTGKVIIAPILDLESEGDRWHTTINGFGVSNYDGVSIEQMAIQMNDIYNALWEPMR